MLLVFHDSAKIGERVTTRYTILHCAILHFTLYDTKLRGDLTRSQTDNFRRPVLHSNIDLFETFDHGETHVSMDTCSHVATDFVSDVLLSLNLLVFVRDDTSYVRSDPNLCLFHSIWVLFSHKRRRTDSSSDEDVFVQSSRRYDDCIIST